MEGIEIGWTVVGVLVSVLIGVGFSVLGYNPPEFTIARCCFWLSALILGGMQMFWQYQTERPAPWRITVGVAILVMVGVGLPECLRWVNSKEREVVLNNGRTELTKIAPIITWNEPMA